MYRETGKAVMLAALLATGAAALAAGSVARQVAVKVSDLDLQTEAGRQELQRRVTLAARKVCPDVDSRTLRTKMAGRACVDRAVREALGQVGERQLAGAPALESDRS
jgi:UrcA family protein